MPSEMRAVPDDNWNDLDQFSLVTRADIAALAGVQTNTVRIWAQTSDTFPDPVHIKGFRPAFHRWGEITEWLCRTGRLPCPETDGLLSKAHVAEQVGMSPSKFKQTRMAGKFPEPDVRIQRAPYWRPLTVKRWLKRKAKAA